MNGDIAKIRDIRIFSEISDLEIELLSGRTNLNYKVKAEGQIYFVRLNRTDYESHSINRRAEFTSIENLHKLGLGPRPIFFCEETQAIVTEFLDYPTWTIEEIKTKDSVSKFGEALSLIHMMPSNGNEYNISRVLRNYITHLNCSNMTTLMFCEEITRLIEDVLSDDDLGMCHNDLWYGNFINDGGIKIVDMEMSGIGDIYFDLASFIHFHDLNQEHSENFLVSYSQTSLSSPKLECMKTAVLLREYLWALTQIKTGLADPYYKDYSAECLNSLRELK